MPYKDPEKRKQNSHDYYLKHRDETRKRIKEWARNNKEKCKEYGRKYREAHRGEYNERNRLRREANPEPHRLAALKYKNKLRLEALSVYGGTPSKCACCEEGHIEFLAIDHIGGGGNKHKKEVVGLGRNFYLWLKQKGYPKGYRVLCHNCNMSLGFYGYCPHQDDKYVPVRIGQE